MRGIIVGMGKRARRGRPLTVRDSGFAIQFRILHALRTSPRRPSLHRELEVHSTVQSAVSIVIVTVSERHFIQR
eukprot:scaffold6219_cov106-Skeletonema_dohrnii-CCMP3373.AAC.2